MRRFFAIIIFLLVSSPLAHANDRCSNRLTYLHNLKHPSEVESSFVAQFLTNERILLTSTPKTTACYQGALSVYPSDRANPTSTIYIDGFKTVAFNPKSHDLLIARSANRALEKFNPLILELRTIDLDSAAFSDLKKIYKLDGYAGIVTVQFVRTNNRLIVASLMYPENPLQTLVQVFELPEDSEIPIRVGEPIRSYFSQLSDDGSTALILDSRERLVLYSVSKNGLQKAKSFEETWNGDRQLSPNGQLLIATRRRRDPTLALQNLLTGATRTFFLGEGSHLNNYSFSPDSRRIAIADHKYRIKILHPETGQVDTPPHQTPNVYFGASFSPDGTRLVLNGHFEDFTQRAVTSVYAFKSNP